jgi:nickel superoxide dismutase
VGIGISGAVWGHCQIPCGIYDDETRFTLMLEDVATIEKSMIQIKGLSTEEAPNWNQIVRWVTAKEDHADKLSETLHYYFLAQRVKPVDAVDEAGRGKYLEQLTLLHGMVVHAMKAKQTTDLVHIEKLRVLLGEFKTLYMGEHQH